MTPTPRDEPSITDAFAALLGYDPGALDWRVDAVCAQTDPNLFYPDKGESARPGKKVCSGCPVRLQCLDWALEHDERHGTWGGLSDRERRRLHRPPGGHLDIADPHAGPVIDAPSTSGDLVTARRPHAA